MTTDPTAEVLAALSDPGRRAMLDALRARDGQAVGELAAAVPHLGRHAVLKHVGVLEDAGLVTTRKQGRVRVVHLSAVPLVRLARRWLDDYGLWAGQALLDLKQAAKQPPDPLPGRHHQEDDMTTVDAGRPLHRNSVVIDAPPERVWDALVNRDAEWYFGTTLTTERVDGLPVAGAPYTYVYPDGSIAAEGTILAVQPNERLEMTFSPVWDDAVRDEPAMRMVWRIEVVEGATMVSVEHHDLDPATHTAQQMEGGAVYLVSNLKTWLETGRPMGL